MLASFEFPQINAILRWKDVIEAIEGAINAIERASDIIQSISVKHA